MDESVMVYLRGAEEAALSVYQALGLAFDPKTEEDTTLAPRNADGSLGPPEAWARHFHVRGPGRPIPSGYQLRGSIGGLVTGMPDVLPLVIDTLRTVADVSVEPGHDVAVFIELRPT
ncbi:hypothetical protein ACWEO1_19240 [Kitasatospora cineracea]